MGMKSRLLRKRRFREACLRAHSRFSRQVGVSRERSPELIVSLTSYPPRFRNLHVCLESLLRQKYRPTRIVLWIAGSDRDRLPRSVTRLECRGVEIRSCEDLRSYKKIIFTLREHPSAVIVTADDDVMYPETWLQRLHAAYVSEPQSIHCHRARLMAFDTKGNVYPYRYWRNVDEEMRSMHLVPIGIGGVLYPPGCFAGDVLDESVFMELCETCDDIWLRAMSVIRHVPVHHLSDFPRNFSIIGGSQETALMDNNVTTHNDRCIGRVFERYAIIDHLRTAAEVAGEI